MLKIDAFTVYDFYYYGVRPLMVKKKIKIFWGNPPVRAPLKFQNFKIFKKWPPMTFYNPIFLLQNHLVLSKLGCLQKTRAQNIEIWTNGGHFCDDKGFLWSPILIFKNFISRPILKFFWIFRGECPSTNRYGEWVSEWVSKWVSEWVHQNF